MNTTVRPAAEPAEQRIRRQLRQRFLFASKYPDALALEQMFDPRTRATPALRLLAHELKVAYSTPDARLILCLPPQEGKTSLIRSSVVRELALDPDKRIVYASYGIDLGRKHGRWIREQVIAHRNELGIQLRRGNSAVADWTVQHHIGGVLSVGVETSLTGNPADLAIIDDPIKDREQADSEVYRDRVWEWWTDVLSTRLAPGAPVVLVLTRWHEDDLAGRLLNAPDGHLWRVVNIPAQAEENDPLGRRPGEYLKSARGDRDWDAIRVRVGARTWNALYQGHPTSAEGGIIKRDWWRRYTVPLWEDADDGTRWAQGFDELLISADLTFTGTDSSDFVAIGVWGRRSTDAYLLDQTRGRMDFITTVRRFEEICRKWPQATLKLIEEKANGAALISMLAKRIVGLVPYTPKVGKVQRALAWAPLAESGHVYIPDDALCPWVDEFVEEMAAFPAGAHDDQVDQTSQALDRLLLRPLIRTDDSDDDNLVDDYLSRIGY